MLSWRWIRPTALNHTDQKLSGSFGSLLPANAFPLLQRVVGLYPLVSGTYKMRSQSVYHIKYIHKVEDHIKYYNYIHPLI